MQRNSDVVKFKKRKNVNIGILIFIFISIYTIVNVYLYLSKPQLSIYEVAEQSLAEESTVTGVIVREEDIIRTTRSGYINYYFREGARVSKNSTIYSIDESKKIYEKLTDNTKDIGFTETDISQIRQDILRYRRTFSEQEYNKIYDFKDEITASIRQILDVNLLDNMQEIINNTGMTSTFEIVKADTSGIVSYYFDTLHGLTKDQVSTETFDLTKYERYYLKTGEILEAKSPVYKHVQGDDWSITAPISTSLAESLTGKTTINITVQMDQYTMTVPFSLYQKGTDWYLTINFDKYLLRYIRERFLELTLNISGESGLKIPVSAIIQKEFYLIPKEFFTLGGDDNTLGLVREVYNEKSSAIEPVFTTCEIYFEDDTYAYVDIETFRFGEFIQRTGSEERFQISMVGTLEGVFNVNKGFAVFRRIERLNENEEYVIVKKDTTKGISLYDHIALDAASVVDSAILY